MAEKVCEHTFGEFQHKEEKYHHGVDLDRRVVIMAYDPEDDSYLIWNEQEDKVLYRGTLKEVISEATSRDHDDCIYEYGHNPSNPDCPDTI